MNSYVEKVFNSPRLTKKVMKIINVFILDTNKGIPIERRTNSIVFEQATEASSQTSDDDNHG